MRWLAVLLLIVTIGCGDSDVVEPPEPIVKPEPIQHEILEGIPIGMAEHFSELQEHMTQEEWNAFLKEIDDACNDEERYTYWENKLSAKALKAVKDFGTLLPPYRKKTKENLIRIAGLSMPGVRKVEFTNLSHGRQKVIYLKHDYTIVVELRGRIYETGMGATASADDFYTAEPDSFYDKRIYSMTERISDAWSNQWYREFIPRWEKGEFAGVNPKRIRQQPTEEELARVKDFFENEYIEPHFTGRHRVDLVIIYLDGMLNLLTPEHADLIVDIDDASQATPEQIAEYNRIHSPDAYDCVGE